MQWDRSGLTVESAIVAHENKWTCMCNGVPQTKAAFSYSKLYLNVQGKLLSVCSLSFNNEATKSATVICHCCVDML